MSRRMIFAGLGGEPAIMLIRFFNDEEGMERSEPMMVQLSSARGIGLDRAAEEHRDKILEIPGTKRVVMLRVLNEVVNVPDA